MQNTVALTHTADIDVAKSTDLKHISDISSEKRWNNLQIRKVTSWFLQRQSFPRAWFSRLLGALQYMCTEHYRNVSITQIFDSRYDAPRQMIYTYCFSQSKGNYTTKQKHIKGSALIWLLPVKLQAGFLRRCSQDNSLCLPPLPRMEP